MSQKQQFGAWVPEVDFWRDPEVSGPKRHRVFGRSRDRAIGRSPSTGCLTQDKQPPRNPERFRGP